MSGTRCTCGDGCPTFGACLRKKNIRIEGCRSATGGPDRTAQKKWDAELDAYKAARSQGIQPAGTTMPKIQSAVEVSNKVGKAFDAGTGTFSDRGV